MGGVAARSASTPLVSANGTARLGGCTALVANAEGAPLGCPYQPILGADDGIRTRDPNLGKVVNGVQPSSTRAAT